MKAMYLCSFRIVNGAYSCGLKFTSFRDARKTIRAIALGSCPKGSSGEWWIHKDSTENLIDSGLVKL
jgi:hypothetical protein